MSRGRKAVSASMVDGKLPRERIWDVIRSMRRFAISDLAFHAEVPESLAQSYTHALQRAGYLEPDPYLGIVRDGNGQFTTGVLLLVRDTGVRAPKVNKRGEPVQQGRAQAAMWQVCRVLTSSFSWRDVWELASSEDVPIAAGAAKSYLLALAKAGYFMEERAAAPGRPAKWCLRPEMNTGPKPPMIQRTSSIFDANTGRQVWTQTTADPLDDPHAVAATASPQAQGTTVDSSAVTEAFPHSTRLSHVACAMRLREAGITMTRERFETLTREFPKGVPPREIPRLGERFSKDGGRAA